MTTQLLVNGLNEGKRMRFGRRQLGRKGATIQMLSSPSHIYNLRMYAAILG